MKFKCVIRILSILAITAALFLDIPSVKQIRITEGMSAMEIINLLEEEGVIKNPKLFRFFLKFAGSSRNLQAGFYEISVRSSYISILQTLIDGSNVYVKVTIPEGFKAEEIALRLYENEIIDDIEKFVKEIEYRELRGFLFPETYKFSKNETVKNVINKMTNQFFKNFSNEYKLRAEELGFTLKEIVTLASLIEKEAKVSAERPIISNVFHLRLKKRMRLQSCASVLFAIGEHRDRLLYKDLLIDSPFNTYRNFGLPPTPIANPGIYSLRAALYPAAKDYLFFFSKGDGSHIFSGTYNEHSKRLREFRKKQRNSGN